MCFITNILERHYNMDDIIEDNISKQFWKLQLKETSTFIIQDRNMLILILDLYNKTNKKDVDDYCCLQIENILYEPDITYKKYINLYNLYDKVLQDLMLLKKFLFIHVNEYQMDATDNVIKLVNIL